MKKALTLITLMSVGFLISACANSTEKHPEKLADAIDQIVVNEQVQTLIDEKRDQLIAYNFDLTKINLTDDQKSDILIVLHNLARNTVDTDIIDTLIDNPSGNIKLWLAKNPNLPEVYYKQYLTHEDKDYRAWFAANKGITAEMYQTLSQDPEPSVRWVVAKNPHVPLSILRHLINDENDQVLIMLARNESINVEIMQALIGHQKKSIIDIFHKRDDLPASIQAQVDDFYTE